MKLIINYDDAGMIECPNEWGGWVLHSFNRRHFNFVHPNKFLTYPNEYGEVSGVDIGMRRKLDVGTAFVLSYCEHGLCRWSLRGEGPQCRWDTTSIGGILIWNTEEAGGLHCDEKDSEERYKMRMETARNYLEVYTDWANGSVYFYSLEDDRGNILDSCGGFIGENDLKLSLRNEHPDIFDEKGNLKESLNIEIQGEADFIME